MPALQLESKETYWGGMRFVRSWTGLTLKFINMRAGTQSSMEFHLRKREIYYIDKGVLKLGLREGRGANRSVILRQGQCFEIEPGLMHMRMAITDVTIIEVCSVDDDADTHIVFDGKNHTFEETANGTLSGLSEHSGHCGGGIDWSDLGSDREPVPAGEGTAVRPG